MDSLQPHELSPRPALPSIWIRHRCRHHRNHRPCLGTGGRGWWRRQSTFPAQRGHPVGSRRVLDCVLPGGAWINHPLSLLDRRERSTRAGFPFSPGPTGDNSSIRGPGRSRLPLSASWNHPMACSLILYRPSWGPQPPSSARPRMTNPIRPAARPRPRRSHPPTSAATGLLYLWACHGTTDILIPWKRRELYFPSPRPSPQRRGRTIRRVATNRGISACSATHDGAPSPQGRGLG